MQPFATRQTLLVTIPVVDALFPATIIAEIGADMAAFGTAQRLPGPAFVRPAMRVRASRSRTAVRHLFMKAALVTVAVSAAQAKRSYGSGGEDKASSP